MAAKPVQVSIDESLLREIDRDPEARREGRSAFIRSAVRSYLAAKRRRAIDASIERAYADKADDMLDEIVEIMSGQAWPRK